MENLKIDLLYLWVDGNDPAHIIKRNKYLPESTDFGSVAARFRDNDELRYSLRSAEKFVPWINKIFIATDDQVPSWLDTKNPKITLIDHKDFIPEEYLPTFNSNVIEARIPYIKDLSEYFLFANDDMFFNAPMEPSYFFTADGKPIMHVRHKRRFNKSWFWERWLTEMNAFARTCYQKRYNYMPAHCIDPHRKSFMLENIERSPLKDRFAGTLPHKFREFEDIQRYSHTVLDGANDKAVIVENWLPVLKNRHTICRDLAYKAMLKIDVCKPRQFCINDGENTTDELRNAFANWLEKKFPEKSAFEK